MINNPRPSTRALRKKLLALEFVSLAILLISMYWFSRDTAADITVNQAWLLVPATASLGVFLSFLGLMYLRWVSSASQDQLARHKVIFALLTLTLAGVWVYAIANTWISLA